MRWEEGLLIWWVGCVCSQDGAPTGPGDPDCLAGLAGGFDAEGEAAAGGCVLAPQGAGAGEDEGEDAVGAC